MNRFNDKTRGMLGRKITTDEAPRVRLHGERVGDIDLVLFDGSDSGLNALCAERESSGADSDFFARDLRTGDIFAVAAEGYSYARYIGRLGFCDVERACLRCGGPKR